MDANFWHARWNSGRIGFHNDGHHPLLERHWSAVEPQPGSRVFVPLAGKSLDMNWLADRGHDVVGVELSEVAVREFFEERGVPAVVDTTGPLPVHRHENLALIVGDLFKLCPEMVGEVDAVYDRAALIALPPDMRRAYVLHLRKLAPAAPTLLITVEYDQSQRGGPPFSVESDEVHELYGAVERLGEAAAALRDLSVIEAAYIARHGLASRPTPPALRAP